MSREAGHDLTLVDGVQAARPVEGDVRNGLVRGAIAGDAPAGGARSLEVEPFREDLHDHAGEAAATPNAVIAAEGSVLELAQNAAAFDMQRMAEEIRIPRSLDDLVGNMAPGDIVYAVVKRAADRRLHVGSGKIHAGESLRNTVGRNGRDRAVDRKSGQTAARPARIRRLGAVGHLEFFGEVLADAKTRLTRPGITGHVLVVDDRRRQECVRRRAARVQAEERVHLAEGEMRGPIGAEVLPIELEIKLAPAEVP